MIQGIISMQQQEQSLKISKKKNCNRYPHVKKVCIIFQDQWC